MGKESEEGKMKLIMITLCVALLITPITVLSETKRFIGYKYTFDLDDNAKDKLAIYAKIKKPSLEMKFGVESKYRDMSKSSALFLSQEFKF